MLIHLNSCHKAGIITHLSAVTTDMKHSGYPKFRNKWISNMEYIPRSGRVSDCFKSDKSLFAICRHSGLFCHFNQQIHSVVRLFY